MPVSAEPLKDTSFVNYVQPDSLAEMEIFSDSKLQYNINTKYEPGMLDRFLEWLSGILFGDVEYKSISLTRQMIIWMVVILFLVIAVRIIWRSGFTALIKPQGKTGGFNFEEFKDGLSDIPFEKKIQEAETTEDWRTAVRWRYLFALYALEKNGYLEFMAAKTNFDYLRDLHKAPFKKEFAELSRIFEYVWYGKFGINVKGYNEYATLFKQFHDRIKNV